MEVGYIETFLEKGSGRFKNGNIILITEVITVTGKKTQHRNIYFYKQQSLQDIGIGNVSILLILEVSLHGLSLGRDKLTLMDLICIRINNTVMPSCCL